MPSQQQPGSSGEKGVEEQASVLGKSFGTHADEGELHQEEQHHQELPPSSEDLPEDTRRLVQRLNAPVEPQGKKLFIGGISWRSDEGVLLFFSFFNKLSSRRRRCFDRHALAQFSKTQTLFLSLCLASSLPTASIRSHFERFGQIISVVRNYEEKKGRREFSFSPLPSSRAREFSPMLRRSFLSLSLLATLP